MKITQNDYIYLKTEMAKLLEDAHLHMASLKNQSRYASDQQAREQRHRWDWMRAANLENFILKTIYSYANDSHVDTALAKIQSELLA